MNLHLTVATGRYDRTAALHDGRVRPEGIDVTWLALPVEEIFWRMFRHLEFDVSELSLGSYVVRRARGREDLVAIPVFPSRSFRHSAIYVRQDSSLTRFDDLRGLRVGVPEYQMTAAVWVRAILTDEYRVHPEDISWVEGGLEQPGRRPVEAVRPTGVAIEAAPHDRCLLEMLVAGELDALVTARAPSALAHGHVRRLLADPWAAERTSFRRTGIFPIMHVVAIRRAVLDEQPWVAQTLFRAFEEAKRIAQSAMLDRGALAVTLPFLGEHVEATEALMGADPWPYGLEANRHTLQSFLGHAYDQGLLGRRLGVEELFAPGTTDTALI